MVICLEQGADCLYMIQLMHPKTLSSLVSFKSRLVIPLWYWLSRVVLENTHTHTRLTALFPGLPL